MCGICGIWGVSDQEALGAMLAKLRHRGPDDEGRYLDEPVAVGVRRLAVIDPRGGHQPVSNETGTVVAVLNGEIYNYRDLRHELLGKGHRFTSHGDTEVLVHLYEEEGDAMLQRLRGMFALAIWDRRHRRLLLARDPLGIKPLYYAEDRGSLTFASELPALLAAKPHPSIDPRAVANFLTLLYVPAPASVFAGVRQLLPGEMLDVRSSGTRSLRYGTLTPPRTAGQAEPVTEEEFREVLRDSVRAHLVSDVPLGLFLSGGLDSGALLAFMRSVTNGPLRTFSIGYAAEADRSYNELDAARMLATHFGSDHTEEWITPNAAKLIPEIVRSMGEPFADSSSIPTYLVSQVARRSVTVALSGIGGDELFGGYPRYLGMRTAAWYTSVPVRIRHWLGGVVASRLKESGQSRDHVGRLKRFLRSGDLPMAGQYWRWITFLPSEWGCSAFTPELAEEASEESLEARHTQVFEACPSQAPEDRAMWLDLQTYLPDDLLRMGDRLSMAHSLELRVPFCDPEVLRLAMSLSSGIRFRGWRLKGFMRHALAGTLPPAILARGKYGFMVPLARWLREDLREMTHDLLHEDVIRRRGYVTPAYVAWLLREHDAGRRNCADQIYALLVLELWHREWIGS